MSKGFRVLLQIFQALFLIAALLFMTFSFLMAYADFGGTEGEERFVDTWIMGFALLSIAVSPALWALSRRGQAQSASSQAGSFDRAAFEPVVSPQPQSPKPGGVFEPMNPSAAPAPPASSYGQPSAGFGSSQQGDSPWGSGR